jgi:glycosyltransferase involved in cell wall biosynthesis
MNFNNLRKAYKDLKSLLMKYKNTSARLHVSDMMLLCKAFDLLQEISDHSAIIHVYKTLQKSGGLAYPPRHDQRDFRLYMAWLRAKLKVVEYTQGLRLLDQARDWFPDHTELYELRVFYLWFHDRSYLDGWLLGQDFPTPVPEALLVVYGEHLIRMGQVEEARALAFLANIDPRRRQDMVLFMVNSQYDSVDKLLWFNRFLQAQDMSSLTLKPGQTQFGIDTLQGTGSPRPGQGDLPLISVITTAYNCADYLETSVQSILNQSWQNLELLLVDDCSDHATREKIRELAASDPRVVPVFRSENGGTYIAKSEAMARARGKFVIFHDADDWAHPDKLWQEAHALQAQPELACWCSGWARIDENSQFVMQLSGKYAHPNPAGTLLRHPQVFDRLGGFDPVRTGADSAYKRRIQLEFGPRSLRTDPRVLVLGRHHSSSLTQTGSMSMSHFGWSPSRALYRGNWVDALVMRDKKHWSPLGMRKTPIKIPYQAEDVLSFDPMRRLGLSQQFEDFLLIIQGRMSDRHLTQIHRLVMALHQTGYRVGVYFEDRVWADETWQGRQFQELNHIHYYGDLGAIRAKICFLVNAHPAGSHFHAMTRDRIDIDSQSFAHPVSEPEPVTSATEALFLMSPDINKILPEFLAMEPKKLIVLTATKHPGARGIRGLNFSFQCVTAPMQNRENCVVLCGEGWNDETRFEALMLARLLGRKCLQSNKALAQIDLANTAALQELVPQQDTQPMKGEDYVRVLAQRLSKHLAIQPTLNLEWVMALPETGL